MVEALAVSVTGTVVAVGLVASAPKAAARAQCRAQLVTAGPGTLTVLRQRTDSAECKTDAQQYESSSEDCIQHYESGTRVTLTAAR
jgi:hypothetical protein